MHAGFRTHALRISIRNWLEDRPPPRPYGQIEAISYYAAKSALALRNQLAAKPEQVVASECPRNSTGGDRARFSSGAVDRVTGGRFWMPLLRAGGR